VLLGRGKGWGIRLGGLCEGVIFWGLRRWECRICHCLGGRGGVWYMAACLDGASSVEALG
jgi:hypothetical protein